MLRSFKVGSLSYARQKANSGSRRTDEDSDQLGGAGPHPLGKLLAISAGCSKNAPPIDVFRSHLSADSAIAAFLQNGRVRLLK
jgi:hypothetical protein